MTDRVEIRDFDTPCNKGQSEMFEDVFLRNLKGLQAKIQQQHVHDTASKSGDMQYIGENTRKLIELKLLELDSIIIARKKEEEWLRKREIRQAQKDRIAEARCNLNTLLMLEGRGKCGLEDDIEKNLSILREVANIGGEEIYIDRAPVDPQEILDSFHVTEKDLKRALDKNINILDFVRKAKENGWTMKVTDDEIALYGKNGKRITGGVPDKDFVGESPKPKRKRTTKATKATKATKKKAKCQTPNKVRPKRSGMEK